MNNLLMIAEKISLNIDVQKLKDHVQMVRDNYEAVKVGRYFGGWSVYSSTGSFQDGWAHGELIYQDDFMPGSTMKEKAEALGIKSSWAYVQETEICTGYLKEIMDHIKSLKLSPRRARLSLIRANGATSIHQDAPDGVYSVRLHIPIVTNPKCLFICGDKREHFKDDGSAYFISVSRIHQAVNEGDTDRIHLIMDVTDENQVTQFHRKPENEI